MRTFFAAGMAAVLRQIRASLPDVYLLRYVAFYASCYDMCYEFSQKAFPRQISRGSSRQVPIVLRTRNRPGLGENLDGFQLGTESARV
jgi:hypothetical protein